MMYIGNPKCFGNQQCLGNLKSNEAEAANHFRQKNLRKMKDWHMKFSKLDFRIEWGGMDGCSRPRAYTSCTIKIPNVKTRKKHSEKILSSPDAYVRNANLRTSPALNH